MRSELMNWLKAADIADKLLDAFRQILLLMLEAVVFYKEVLNPL